MANGLKGRPRKVENSNPSLKDVIRATAHREYAYAYWYWQAKDSFNQLVEYNNNGEKKWSEL